jgi:hypothetical protein
VKILISLSLAPLALKNTSKNNIRTVTIKFLLISSTPATSDVQTSRLARLATDSVKSGPIWI